MSRFGISDMRRVVILANSHKLQGRCIAGIDLVTRAWIRPLGSLAGGALSRAECMVVSVDGPVEVGPGDIVEMSDGVASGSSHHPEDVDGTGPWRIVDRMSTLAIEKELRDLIAIETPLLGLPARDVPLAHFAAGKVGASLQLARSSAVNLYWKDRPGHTRQLRARVKLIDTEEDLALTDPRIETKMARRTESRLDRCLLTVSLSEPYPRRDGQMWCSKLIAAALPLR